MGKGNAGKGKMGKVAELTAAAREAAAALAAAEAEEAHWWWQEASWQQDWYEQAAEPAQELGSTAWAGSSTDAAPKFGARQHLN